MSDVAGSAASPPSRLDASRGLVPSLMLDQLIPVERGGCASHGCRAFFSDRRAQALPAIEAIGDVWRRMQRGKRQFQ